jgi:hypothetical protein
MGKMGLDSKIKRAHEMIRTGKCPTKIKDCTYCPVWNSVSFCTHEDLGISNQNQWPDDGLRRWVRGWLALAIGKDIFKEILPKVLAFPAKG